MWYLHEKKLALNRKKIAIFKPTTNELVFFHKLDTAKDKEMKQTEIQNFNLC